MFIRERKPVTHELDGVITSLISELERAEPGEEIHTSIAETLKKLMELRAADLAAERATHLSPDAIASIAGSLLGIGLILSFEKANVITSKGLSFVPKIRT